MASPITRGVRAALPAALLAATASFAHATDLPSDQVTTLSKVKVSASAHAAQTAKPVFPATVVQVTAERIETTTNAVDVEDAVKYLPSLFVRKRNYGDTQPVLATRTWGVNASARSLVYVDDVPISALIANNNTIGAPRWGITAPEAIDHVEMLYGPYSAAYAGNALGGMLRLVTRLPEKPEISVRQIVAVQDFDQYGTHDHLSTSQTSLSAAGRSGRWGWLFAANAQNSFSQPLSYITAASFPSGTRGGYVALNKTGQPADVLGAGGLLHTRQLNLDGKLLYDITPWLQASYLVGFWSNHGHSAVDTYLTDAQGRPSYGKTGGFASNTYRLAAHHLMQAATLKSDTKGDFDGEAVLTHYAFLKDNQWSPASVLAGDTLSSNGRLASYAGTNWSTLDLKGLWRPQGYGGAQEIAFGAHGDRYELDNPTRNLADWRDPDSVGTLYAAGAGKTRTNALWLQDAWRFAPAWLLTVGGREEWWKASDGFNASGKVMVHQPTRRADAFSPKATLQWDAAPDWRVTGSLAKAVRFPTVGELYQLVATGSTYTSPNPDLKPERALSGELAIEHAIAQGLVRVSLFQETTRDALIQQTAFLAGYTAPVNYVVNVDKVRNRGVELVAQREDALVRGLELAGSVTFVDSTILKDDAFVGTNGSTARGKHAPYVPRWRATATATYRPNADLAFTLAGRYSGPQYSTLDNSDHVSRVFGAFDSFVVFDARVQYRLSEHLTAALGVDNLNNRKYFLYHPFPQRTVVADLKLSL
ncbi:TonB-dependent receptor [Aerosticca soli]|uniref:Outer membrane receptor proteins, mostly Fe transport n=1 Tax=Aerosticca soli TaxID=2010829 RepID=A0A2Z6E4L9_9GAMM|nr:TonB-dependent receptor [Aerosticca soli]BBD79459.1 outer membrane receptor proteins, mostly Fe transport [Aerosticca soli]